MGSTFQLVPVEEHYLQTLRRVNLNTTQENLDALRDFAIVQGERQAEAHNGHTDWQNDSFFNDVLQNTSFCNRINAQTVEFQQVGVVGEDVRSIASTISSVSHGGAGDCAGFETDCSDDSVMILAETPQKPMNTSEASVQCTEELPSTRVMTCPICWVDYIKIKSRPDPNKSQIISITSCGHVLCRDCLKNAFPRRNYQPTVQFVANRTKTEMCHSCSSKKMFKNSSSYTRKFLYFLLLLIIQLHSYF